MGTRIFGLRSSYSVMFAADGQREPSGQEAGHRLLGPVVSGDLRRGVPAPGRYRQAG